jgi:Kef-type K+ transport system membrane component KefB
MILLSALDLSLPLKNPILIFAIILFIILFAPLILNKFKIPHLIGLIIAGAVIGPFGFGLMERGDSIKLFGTVGLMYIMFLAGLEIDLVEFKKNSGKSLVFGMFTFLIPMALGTLSGLYVLSFGLLTSILLASMFASHTLLAYPLVSKLGVAKNRAVTITVGGTMITDTLALLVLAVIVGMTKGEINQAFWIKLGVSVVVFALVVMLIFPLIGRWFFKRFDDSVSQYIFVLGMVFLGAFLAELAGVEGIIGAFLVGLALNRLIPHTSALMNRVEFVGNALFIPFFLIGVGMLINYKAFFKDLDTIKVALVMCVVATLAKFLAAWLTQKTFRFSIDERRLIFGLSNAQAAATLAAVLVGYEIVIGKTPAGEDIRLLNESVLNGTILMILVTCTIASFVAQKGAQNIALQEAQAGSAEEEAGNSADSQEKILIALDHPELVEELVNLSVTVKNKKNRSGLLAAHIIDNQEEREIAEKRAKKILHQAAVTASGSDNVLSELLRYDVNLINGLSNLALEQHATDLVFGFSQEKGLSISFLNTLDGILTRCNTTTLIYKPLQPLSTIKRHLVIIPENAEREIGFPFWVMKIWSLAKNTGAKMLFYCTETTEEYLRQVLKKHPIEADFETFTQWEDFLIIPRDLKPNDGLIVVMSRIGELSYNKYMAKVPMYLNKYINQTSVLLIYPIQRINNSEGGLNYNQLSLEPLQNHLKRLDDIGKTIVQIFRKPKA